MKRLLMILTMAWAAMSVHAITVPDTIFNRSAHEDFAFGADVSFVPQMESWGRNGSTRMASRRISCRF